MINIIVNGPEGKALQNPIWEINDSTDYAFVDLHREVCQKLSIDPRRHKIQMGGEDVQMGSLCLNHLTRGDSVDVVEL